MRKRDVFVLVVLLTLILCVIPVAWAQDITITNLDQLAQVALSANYSIYLPFEPWDWRAYPTDWPLWYDSSSLPCLDSLPTSTNFMSSMDWSNVPLASVILTKDVLSGVVTVSADGTNVIVTIPAPSGYQPGVGMEDHWLWAQYVSVTNDPVSWGLTPDQILPPTVTLRTYLASSNAYYSVYQSNLEAEAEAATAVAANTSIFTAHFLAMDEEDDFSSGPCAITNEATPFGAVSVTMSTQGCSVAWSSCTDHVYIVQWENNLTPTSSWTDVAWMFGTDQETTWTDTNAVGQVQGFYRVVRASPTNTNNGIPYGWAVSNGLDPLDPNLAWEDPDGDGFTNWQEYQAHTDPRNPNSHPNSMLIIPNAWAVYASSNAVQITADVRTTNALVNVKAAEYFLDAVSGTNGAGTAMSASNSVFGSTNVTAVETFTPTFAYGTRHVIYLHAEGQDGQWTPFKQVILNPNANDILNKIQANYLAFQDLEFAVTSTEYDDGVAVVTDTATVKMKGPYEQLVQYDNGFTGVQNENEFWWHNDALNIGGAMTTGINGDFSVQGSRESDFFWDVPLCQARTVPAISISSNSATFTCQLAPQAGMLWPSQSFGTDFTKGFVTEFDGQSDDGDVSIKSEYLNPVEVVPGHWMYTFHRHTMTFDSGDTVVVESAMTGITANQGLDDSLFDIPEE
ncbi:MAG TPA: Amuc_1099 family pilus-like system protein [Verrucomicrobiae bacterium]|nr:Amuc_1099 family pilus-like system protein [Verrucomicrobiae bacterium]